MNLRRAATLLATLALAAPALAGNQDLYGFGTRGPALGGAAVAFPRGFEAIWYNPAGLVIGPERSFAFGFQATSFDLSIDSLRPGEVEGIADEEAISGVTLGVAVKLPLLGALRGRIALGLGLYIPTETLLSARVPRPYTPQFSLVGDRARTLSISAGIAVEIAKWLRIGAGVRSLAGLSGFIEVAPNELGTIGSNVEDELVTRFAPVLGAVGAPHPDWSIGLAYRGELGAKYDLPVSADLGDKLPIAIPTLRIAGMAVFDPGQVALHLGWRPVPQLTVEAGVTWRAWSAFPLPIQNTTPALPPQPDLAFVDTFSPRAGLEGAWDLGKWRLTGRAGYAFEPTPVPEQTGLHTFLDSDRHVASAGLGVGYGAPGVEGFRLDLDLFGQIHVMAPRHVAKSLDTGGEAVLMSASPAFPWIGHEGSIYSFGASLGLQL